MRYTQMFITSVCKASLTIDLGNVMLTLNACQDTFSADGNVRRFQDTQGNSLPRDSVHP